MNSQNKPILVTGAHRSGTTWAAQMLGLAANTLLAEEPFNVEPTNYALGGLADRHFVYAPGLEDADVREKFEAIYQMKTRHIFKRKTTQHFLPFTRRGRLIIKDPIASLSSEWIAENFDLDVLVLVRHPCAFTESLRRMNWEPDLSLFTEQPALVEDHLKPLIPLINEYDTDFIRRCALTWKILYHVLNCYSEMHPSWVVRTHEALSEAPLQEFEDLYEQFCLPWTDDVRAGIERSTGSSNRAEAQGQQQHCLQRDSRANAWRWKEKMTIEQVEQIKYLTYPEWKQHYTEDQWTVSEPAYAAATAS